jgi:hypothetical protein
MAEDLRQALTAAVASDGGKTTRTLLQISLLPQRPTGFDSR